MKDPHAGKPIHLLLVDDDCEDQYIFTEAIQELNADIHCMVTDCGAKALDILNDEATPFPDYIFLDMNMPRMNGITCIREIRKLDACKFTPIIIHSTANLQKEAGELIDAGASFFFQKPVTLKELSNTLKNILSTDLS